MSGVLQCALGRVSIAAAVILQEVQKAAVWVVSCAPYRVHITQTLRGLYWLPISHWTSFYVLLLTCKVTNNSVPGNLEKRIKSSQLPSNSIMINKKNLACFATTQLLLSSGNTEIVFFTGATSAVKCLPCQNVRGSISTGIPPAPENTPV